ncbi:hypothetical protein AKJ13_29825 [Methylobacterium sp. ARG-1]|nr:hypothetical protein AKJ13_29825 [Methylobacterium sp. ARG-1]
MTMRPLVIAGALIVGATVGALAQAAPQESEERVCQTRADELKITEEMRDTYMRECLAGERVDRRKAETK